MKLLTFMFLSLFIKEASAFVPLEAFTFDFNVKTVKMSRIKEEKLYTSLDLLRQVFSSPEFKRRILLHKYKGKFRFAHNRGLSNIQIYHHILKGMEELHPYRNNAMDVEVELYADFKSKVLGFTRPSTKRIWMNKKYFNKHSPAEVASHLTHEWLHKLGFDHEKERTENRKYSVPYAVGYIVKELAREIQDDY